MPDIATLLNEETRTKVLAVAAGIDPSGPASLPTSTDEVDIDPRSGALIEAACADCAATILVHPTVPDGVDPEAKRKFVCRDCAKTEVLGAIEAQRHIEIIRRNRVAAQSRAITTQENTMTIIDIDTIPDAELGALLKKTMRAEIAEALPVLRAEALRIDLEAAKVDDKQAEADRKANRKVLGAFTVGDLEVPALDLRDLTDLNEVAPAVIRSPYNKARKRLTQEGPLDKETTTYGRLAAEHKILRKFAKKSAKAPRLAKLMQEPSVFVAAEVAPDMQAQVETLMGLGWSKKKATRMAKVLA